MEMLVTKDVSQERAMEMLVETSIAVEDDDTATLWMEKKRRRVSFAHTDTVHVIPRNDDLQTPPDNPPFPLDIAIAGDPASHPTIFRVSAADPDLLSGSRLYKNSADFSQFTCDMDTSHGGWADEEFTNSPNSFNGLEDDSGCFVHLGHISRIEDDDSIVNDVLDHDMTMDVTTFSRNLSYYLKSGTNTFQGTGLLGYVLSHKSANDSDSRSEDESMALTNPGAPHSDLVNPRDVFMHADDEQTDMSLATGLIRQVASQKTAIDSHSESDNDPTVLLKPGAPHCTLVCPQDVSLCAEDNQSDLSLTTGTAFKTITPKHTVEVSRDGNRNTSIIGVDQPSIQFEDVSRNGLKKKPVLMEVKKSSDGQQLIKSSLQVVTEPRSLSKVQESYKAKASRPVLADSTNLQQLPKDNLQEDKKLCKASPQTVRMTMSSKVSAGVGNLVGVGKEPHTKGSSCLEDILQCLKGKTLHEEDQGGEENMTSMLSTKLQTLGDYLQFSCSVQPQMDWLREHVQELEAKLQATKERNAEIKSSNSFVQKLPEESTCIFKSKFASTHSLAKKGWLVWKMKPEKQMLAWLQGSKDNLMKEVEALHDKGQQVLNLKESYSQILLKVERSVYSGQAAATSKEAQLLTHRETGAMESTLEKYNHRYQDACERLRISKAKLNKLQTQIQSLASAYGHKVQSAADNSEVLFEKNLKASIQKLLCTNNLLHRQQVMEPNLKSNGGKSLIDFSLDGMCSQSFQFEGDSPQVKLLSALHPDVIEMRFPCMYASLLFQYINRDLHSVASVQMQHVYGIIQRTNHLFGCSMDVLKEIKYCRRSCRISCQFQMQDDKLLLYVTFLRCEIGFKITLIFDMACVKRRIYPSDLKPADIQMETYGCASNDSVTKREVRARIAKIQPGFARLHRICSCVEELMRNVKENT